MQISYGIARKRCPAVWFLAVALGALVATAPISSANNKKAKPTDVPASVLAHLPLPLAPGNEMVLQKIGDKQYLYIQLASNQGFLIVNVTKPDQPYLINRPAKSSDGAAGKLEVVGPDLGISEVPDKTAPTSRHSAETPTETVRLLDLSDPTSPKTIQTFQGVTSILGDPGRALVFLTNGDGLWILKHRHEFLQPSKTKPRCDSESAIQAMPPDCE
jgi:hypothetical protein